VTEFLAACTHADVEPDWGAPASFSGRSVVGLQSAYGQIDFLSGGYTGRGSFPAAQILPELTAAHALIAVL
jgi:hypothetical protein